MSRVPIVPLSEVITPASVRRAGEDQYPILSMTMRDGLVDQETKFKKRVASADLSQYKVIRRDQLVVGFPIDEGVLAFQDLYDEAIVSPAYGVWDLKSATSVDSGYLQKYLRSPGALTYYGARLQGTTARRRSLPSSVFLALDVPLPPVEEQRRIAAILDHADALRAKRREALTRLDELTQSIFVDMFAAGFPLTTVGDVALQVTDGEHQTPTRSTEGVLLLSARNVHHGRLDLTKVDYVSPSEYERISRRCDPKAGDVLISCSGTIGRIAVVPVMEPFSLVRSVALVRLPKERILPEFAMHHLRTQSMQSLMKQRANASSQANLFQGPIRELPIPVPPIPLQQLFVSRLTQVESIAQRHRAALTDLDALFASLQSRAFRGEL